MSLPTLRTSRRAASARAVRTAALVGVEQLEEICLLSGAPWQSEYAAWRDQSFTIGGAGEFSISLDTLQGAGEGAAALSANPRAVVGADTVNTNYGYTGTGYTVAVLDTGIDHTHAALAANYIGGWDFVDDDSDPFDLNGHGTHVAGIIGSTNASYLGIAPDVNIIALRVLDASGTGSFGDVEDALQWVVDNQETYNIVAVNMSLGAGNYSFNPYYFMEDELQDLKDRGVFVAAASGNSFYQGNSQQGLGYPAISSNTVSVGAVWSDNFGSVTWGSGAKDHTTAQDRITSFTQRNAALDIVAPGAFITSTYLGNTFASMAGTSMAAPVVAAAAALVHQALDDNGLGHLANQDTILDILQTHGVDVIDGDDENDNVTNTGHSFKRLNLLAAIESLATPPGEGVPDGSEYEPLVAALYQDILGRAVDETGLAAWSTLLAGGATTHDVVSSLWNSPEHRAGQVQEYFQDFLGRDPSQGELNVWVSVFQVGLDEMTAMRIVVGAPEYSAVYSDDAAFVTSLYEKILDRTPGSSETDYWVGLLNGGTSRLAVSDSFFFSTENLLQEVDSAYQDCLGREADAGGRQFWLNSLRNGSATLDSMSMSMLQSAEYVGSVAAASASTGTNGFAASADTSSLGQLSGFWLTPEQAESAFSGPQRDRSSGSTTPDERGGGSLATPTLEDASSIDRLHAANSDQEDATLAGEIDDSLLDRRHDSEHDLTTLDGLYDELRWHDVDDDGLPE